MFDPDDIGLYLFQVISINAELMRQYHPEDIVALFIEDFAENYLQDPGRIPSPYIA